MVLKPTRSELSCGVLLFQERPLYAYLVLYRKDGSPDLPKGHQEKGESDLDTALRELEEETGIDPARVRITPDFVFDATYLTRAKKSGDVVEKTVRVFHGVVDGPVVVRVDGHADYAWMSPESDAVSVLAGNPTFLGALRAWLAHRPALPGPELVRPRR